MTIMILNGCGPVKVEGDVFLVKGDGKPQPSAAKEVIFIEAESFEDLLIETYLETVQSDIDSSKAKLETICTNASDLIQTEISETESFLNANISEQKASGITDVNGSCDSFQITFDEAFSAASSSRNQFSKLIAEQDLRIQEARQNILDLKSTLETKIRNKENELYEEFTDQIIISLSGAHNARGSERGVLVVANQTPYNIRLDGDLCLQFYNSEGDPVGTSYSNSLYECTYNPSGMFNGTRLLSSDLFLNVEQDEFGFTKGGFLAKGQSSVQKFGFNAFCYSQNYTASEALVMTRKYGEDRKSWPNLDVPDISKGYEIISSNEYRDKASCGYTDVINKNPKFIPLEDEVRIEAGDSIIYASKEVNFREIAETETHPEIFLIKEQEETINTANIELERLRDESSSDPLIEAEINAEEILTSCNTANDDNAMLKESINQASLNLDDTKSCSLDDGTIFDSLMSVALTDEDLNQLEMIIDKDYSAEAALAMMMKFADSKYITSTNISGRYVINEIPKGKYVIYSSYADNFNSGIYIDDIEITDEAQIDLSNTKFLNVSSLQSLINAFYRQCSGTICSDSDLRYTLGNSIDQAERSYKDLKESEERLQESLRELERLLGG